ncbi:aldehyde oxidase [Clostridium sp. W14A]|uniref:Xanthine dehydrogenase family protein molybdopterin-binding subunit n=1 Tax=Caproicibacter fermentans TaxID=2576756 RepID=A0A7G8TAD5_9FIRM|nr:xanthine dehydrogenase family protein molybdopterin-binding subunit [Caproicibacter fermentans]OCN03093.1 aldehyde oxidase [Clostridium sp. W14A]QNK40576.1 xanthine dehydrogenase family protein molybdopterin-binding subunit [Caproicibacter fermentans]
MPKAGIGTTVIRKEAWDKVTGNAKYTADENPAGVLTARMVTSTFAHAKIKKIDYSQALLQKGVKAVITGEDYPVLSGGLVADRPPLANGKVRYYGEPVALVVADSEFDAANAVTFVKVEYEPLPVINSLSQALASGAPLVHEHQETYKHISKDLYPQPGTNICDIKKIRKGDVNQAFSNCDSIVEAHYSLPQSDHIAMETRAARARISPDGTVFVKSASQAPFGIKKELSSVFNLEQGKVVVEVPFVGGGFGGKAATQLELLAYMASKAVCGREVGIRNSREQDITSSPCKLGLDATLKLGATKDGMIKAAQMTYLVDAGAYADMGPRLSKAMAVDCTGPYNIENVSCDAVCVYTNHPYATSFRGFGHASYTFCVERTLDKLAKKLQMDPLELRKKNGLAPGNLTPTQVPLTASSLGSLGPCIEKLKPLINWEEGERIELGNHKIRAKGISCFWKTSDSSPDAVSGIILTFNNDGSLNVNCGCVECGPSMKTTVAQLLSEKLKMDISRVHVNMDVNTKCSPTHWKTVASMTTFMQGRAAMRAAEDVCRQLVSLAAAVLRCPPEDLEVGGERVYVRHEPSNFIHFKDLVHGYQYQNGNAVEGQIIGRGSFIMGDLNLLDKETGKGKAGPWWTVGAQGVEVEYDTEEYTYRLIKAATVIDAGKVLNPKMCEALVKGGMCMGLGLGTRENFSYSGKGEVLDTSLRTYKVMHFGETPQYLVDFVETPLENSPYGARGLAEHGIIGIPAALANALSVASGVELDELPLVPETIWRIKTGGRA